MSEWIEYDGSDEQLTMLLTIPKHFIVDSKLSVFNSPTCLFTNIERTNIEWLKNHFRLYGVTKFLICEPHRLESMISRQAKTSQPVWIRTKSPRDNHKLLTYKTTKPNWFLADAEYRFEPFKD